jgi:hypothetical protein
MGYSRKRIGRDGKPRYTAYYFDIRGRERSAGTFSSKKTPTRPGRMRAKSTSARTIQYCKQSILNAIFTTALDAEVVTIHPSRGVKTPPVPESLA